MLILLLTLALMLINVPYLTTAGIRAMDVVQQYESASDSGSECRSGNKGR